VILLGDLNATRRSRSYRVLTAVLADVDQVPDRRSRARRATFPSRYPSLRLDHILVGRSIEVLDARTVRTPLASFASDHLPVVAELMVPAPVTAETPPVHDVLAAQ
jgi:endonuclease/exonuclease/phosphatase family metal-dependent hydrolase